MDMTIKQLVIGTLVGAGAVAVLMHRLPKQPAPGLKTPKPPAKADARMTHQQRHPLSNERLSKAFS